MQWSRLRSSVRERLATAVAKRVDVHMASYGASSLDRAWMTLDGRDILTLPEYMTWQRVDPIDRDRLAPSDPQSVLFHEGRITTIGALLHRSLEMPFEALVTSPTVFLRGFARFDRRFGKRRLATPLLADEHPFVVHCHAFRAGAEGIALAEPMPIDDDSRWHRRPIRGSGFSPAAIAAADKALEDRKPKTFATLVRRCRQAPLATDGTARETSLRRAFAGRSAAQADRLAAELIDVAECTSIAEDPQLTDGLVADPRDHLGRGARPRGGTDGALRGELRRIVRGGAIEHLDDGVLRRRHDDAARHDRSPSGQPTDRAGAGKAQPRRHGRGARSRPPVGRPGRPHARCRPDRLITDTCLPSRSGGPGRLPAA